MVGCLIQMNKKMKKLEKECQTYRQRYENTNRALLEMVEQKQQHEKIIDMQVGVAMVSSSSHSAPVYMRLSGLAVHQAV